MKMKTEHHQELKNYVLSAFKEAGKSVNEVRQEYNDKGLSEKVKPRGKSKMIEIIKNQDDLASHISRNGDYNPELTYLSQDSRSGDCFAIFGCTHATEAFRFVSDEYNLVITDDDYSKEIEDQTNDEAPELAGFKLRK